MANDPKETAGVNNAGVGMAIRVAPDIALGAAIGNPGAGIAIGRV